MSLDASSPSPSSSSSSSSSSTWSEVFHAETNRYFYFLPSTGESTWNIPGSTWRKAKDPISGRDWYWHPHSKEVQWDIPSLDLAQKLLLSTTTKAPPPSTAPPRTSFDTVLSPPPLHNSPHNSPFKMGRHISSNHPFEPPPLDLARDSHSSVASHVPPSPSSSSTRDSSSVSVPPLDLDFIPATPTVSTPNSPTKKSNRSSGPTSPTIHPKRFLRSSIKGSLGGRSPRTRAPTYLSTPSHRSTRSSSTDSNTSGRGSQRSSTSMEDELSPLSVSPRALGHSVSTPSSSRNSDYVPYVAPPSPKSPTKASSPRKDGWWICGVCTTENTPRSFTCATCNAPKPSKEVEDKKLTSPTPPSVLKIGKQTIADFEIRGFFTFTKPKAKSIFPIFSKQKQTSPTSPTLPPLSFSSPKHKFAVTYKSKLFYFKSKTSMDDILQGKVSPQGRIKLRECTLAPNSIEGGGYEITSISTSAIYKALIQRITYVQSKSKKEIKSELEQSCDKGGVRGAISGGLIHIIQLVMKQGATLAHERDMFRFLFQPYHLASFPPESIFSLSAILLQLGASGISDYRIQINNLISKLIEEVLKVPRAVYRLIASYLDLHCDVLDIRESIRYIKPKKFQKNLILLGTGEAGKSTIFKQFYNLDETQDIVSLACIDYIMFNMFIFLRSILQNMDLSLLRQGNEEAATLILEEKEVVIRPTANNIRALRQIWADPSVRRALEERDTTYPPFQLWSYSGRYALARLEQSDTFLFNEDELTFQDYLAMQCRTTGSVSITIKIPKIRCDLDIYDTGGQRNERKKWPLVFHEGKTTALVVVRLSEYNEVLFEDFSVNRMAESLNVFQEICRHYIFHDTCLVLLFTFEDEFREKISHVPFPSGIPIFEKFLLDRKLPYQYEDAFGYIKNLFVDAAQSVGRLGIKEVPVYVCCSIETETCRGTLNEILDYIYRWHQEYQHAHLTLV